MPQGTQIAKDIFVVSPNGDLSGGPLFLMEKMGTNFNENTGDWRYTMITAAGKLVGATGGAGDKALQFCADCHNGAEDQDYLFFLTKEFRK